MKHIILVEDDESIRDIFKLVFQKSGYDLLQLDSGEMILNGEIEPPDLFILDRQISGTNGLDVCRFIKSSAKFRNVPVIMVSASPDIVEAAHGVGADEVLPKPFSLKRLRELISGFVG